MQHTVEAVNVMCSLCERTNRIPVDKALQDLAAVKCGVCRAPLFRIHGEALVNVCEESLSHPFDRDALAALRAVPYADKLLSRVFSTTLDKIARFNLLANSLQISPRQAPRLWCLYQEAAGRLNVDRPPCLSFRTRE